MLSIVITEDIINDLKNNFRIEKDGIGWKYISPNGILAHTLSLHGVNQYGKPSYISIPTSEIEKYPLVSEDFLDYYKFSKAVKTETIEQFLKRTTE